MTMEHLMKLNGQIWIVLKEVNNVVHLHRAGIQAWYHKNTSKLIYRDKTNGQFKSRTAK